ncbi:MAG: PTS glucose transporter subunit IIA, partial [Longicatena sp.]
GVGLVLTLVFGKTKAKKSEEVVLELPKEDEIVLNMPMEGVVQDISKCADEMFASKTLGDGIFIEPINHKVFAPADAKVEFIFPTKHAVGLSLKDGSNIMIHFGINTVEINGEGFTYYVKEGQEVKKGDLLIEMDIETIANKGYQTQTMMVLSELHNDRSYNIQSEHKKIIIRAVGE